METDDKDELQELEDAFVDEIENEENIDRVRPIELFPYQVAHYNKVIEILKTEVGYLDTSCFGSGKTISSLAIAATFKMGIMVFAPKTVLINWGNQAKKYGIHLFTKMTYAALRGTAKAGVKHDLLTRQGEEFFPTHLIEQCARSGLLIVFDECHALKNENSQLQAAHALSKEAVRLARMGYNIRIACLSSTPCDKKENVTSLFKILGILNSDKLYKYNRTGKTYVLTGLEETINKCKKYDPDATFHVTCRQITKASAKQICHELYSRILKKYISSSMPEPPINTIKDAKNLFALMPHEDVERMKKGAMLFSSATSYKHETGEVNLSKTNWGDVIRSRREIDSAKVNTMVRLSIEKLTEDPNCKVVLYFTYKRDMEESVKLLKRFNPLLMNGDIVDNDERERLMKKFQRFDNKYRVFISNPKVGGIGVDLDDQSSGGEHRRYMFIAPSYAFIDQFQATGRIHRQTTTSKATIRFIYSREFCFESSILMSFALKSGVVRDMLNSSSNVILPGEYDAEIELTDDEKRQNKEEDEE